MPLPFNTPVMLVDKVMAGVVVSVATVPAKPLAETIDALVTVPTFAEPPKDVATPFIVITELVNALFGIDVKPDPDPKNEVAVIVVPVTAFGVVAPMVMLSIVPTLVGATSIEPVPLGFMWT